MKTTICLCMATMILTAMLAGAVAAQHEVPFKGTFQGNDTVSPPTIFQSITGIGTHVGEFSSTGASSGATGSAQWIAANGDSINTTYVGSAQHVDIAPCQVAGAQPEDSYAKITQVHIITGGTGRFAGAQGSFTLTKYHDVVLRNGTFGTCGSFSGTMTPPGAAH
jgi:hypothetical protein